MKNVQIGIFVAWSAAADGWLPSLRNLPEGEVLERHAAIAAAAVAAGRDPAAIRPP